MTVEARTGRPKSIWGGPDFRRTPYPTGTGKFWCAIGADHVIKPVPFRYFANGLGDDQGTCCSPPHIALRIQGEGADADPTPEGFKSFTQTQSCELANLCNWQNCQAARKSSEPRRIAPGVRGDPLFADQKECGAY